MAENGHKNTIHALIHSDQTVSNSYTHAAENSADASCAGGDPLAV